MIKMTIQDIINAYNAVLIENGNLEGHYIVHSTVTPDKSFAAYKEFKITLYFHTKYGENQVVMEIKEKHRATNPDEIRCVWINMEDKVLKEIVKWLLDGGK